MAAKPRWPAIERAAKAAMKEAGTWSDSTAPMLTEYVAALRQAVEFREAAAVLPFTTASTGRVYAHPGLAAGDAAMRRALSLADALGLTPNARRRLGLDAGLAPDAFDELGARRVA